MRVVRNTLVTILISLLFIVELKAQLSFPEKCEGTWEGTMLIYNSGILRDSVNVRLTVSETDNDSIYSWKTEYLSETLPMKKDYMLKLIDEERNIYITDEQNDIELKDYLFGNKLYSVFEVNGILLTSSYELINEKLIFEVISGAKMDTTNSVINYSVKNLQRVIYSRKE